MATTKAIGEYSKESLNLGPAGLLKSRFRVSNVNRTFVGKWEHGKQNATFFLIIAVFITFLFSTSVYATSVIDTLDKDFAEGSHENTENVNNAVRLEQGKSQGRFTSRVHDIFRSPWDNIIWTEGEPSTLGQSLDNVDNEPDPLSDGLLARRGSVVSGSIQDTLTEDNIYENIGEDSNGTLQWEHRIENVSTTFNGYGFDNYTVKIKGYTSGDSEPADVYILLSTGQWTRMDNLVNEEKTITFLIPGKSINDYLYNGGISIRYVQSDADVIQTIVHIDLCVVEKSVVLKSEIKLHVRISDDNSTWSEWKGPDNTPGTFFTNGPGTGYSTLVMSLENIPSSTYIQYRVYFSNENWELSEENGPKLYDVTINYTLPAPTLLSPADDSLTNNNKPTFNWADMEGADSYKLLIDDDPAFASPEVNISVFASEFPLAEELVDGLHYWKIQARNINLKSSLWSDIWRFRVDTVPPSVPNLHSPENGWTENVNDTTATTVFRWLEASDVGSVVIGYTIQVDEEPTFTSPLLEKDVIENTYTTVFPTGSYYWRVRARDNAGNIGMWSETWYFKIQAWSTVEVWSASVNTKCEWQPIESWSGSVIAESVPPEEFVPPPPTTGSFIDNADEDFAQGILGQLIEDADDEPDPLSDDVLARRGSVVGGSIQDTAAEDNVYENIGEDSNGILQWEHRIESVSTTFNGYSFDNYEVRIKGYTSGDSEPVDVYILLSTGQWMRIDNLVNEEKTIKFFIPGESIGDYLYSSGISIRYVQSDADGIQTVVHIDLCVVEKGENIENAEGTVRLIRGHAQGCFVSRAFYIYRASWDNLVWAESEPTLTGYSSSVRLQISVSDDGLTWSEWKGPDNTPNTYFETSPAQLENIPDANYITYIAHFSSDSPELSGENGPLLNEVSINYTQLGPVLLSPQNGENTPDATPTFDWEDFDEAVRYTLEVSRNPNFIYLEIKLSVIGVSEFTGVDPLLDGYHYWRVKAWNAAGEDSAWSTVWWFRIDTTPPSAPQLVSPESRYATEDTTLTLTWGAVTDDSLPLMYNLQVATDEDFDSIVRDLWTENTTQTIKLIPGAYYWRVRARDNLGNTGEWSGSRWFEIRGWMVFEKWSGMIEAPAVWCGIEIWKGTIEAQVRWGAIEAWDGLVDTLTIWRVTESWYGIASAWASWRTVENWEGTVKTSIYWYAVETWSGIVRAPIPAPALISPENLTQTDNNLITFDWDNLQAADTFTLQIDTDQNNIADFSIYESIVVPESEYTYVEMADGLYFWRVNITRAGVTGPWSENRALRIDTIAPLAPQLTSPVLGENINDNAPLLDWDEVPENTFPLIYEVQLSTDPDFYDTTLWIITEKENYRLTTLLVDNLYHWRVRVRDGVGNMGEWSLGTFRVDTVPPSKPSLTWPSDGDELTDSTLTLRWNPVTLDNNLNPEYSLPILYYVSVSDDSAFLYENFSSGWIEDNSWKLSLSNGAYYWRVRAQDDAGNVGEYSITRQFRVATPPVDGVDEEPPGEGILPSPDIKGPELQLLEPTTRFVGENVTVKVRITDVTGVDENSIAVTLDNIPKPYLWANGLVTIELRGLSIGDHTIEVKASDAIGNENSMLIYFMVLEGIPTEDIVMPLKRVDLLIGLEVPVKEDGTARVENGTIRVTLRLMNPTDEPVVKSFKIIFAGTELSVQTELGPYENVEIKLFLSVEGVDPGIHTLSVVDPDTGEVIETKRIVLAAAPPEERAPKREVIPVAPPPLNLLYLSLLVFVVTIPVVRICYGVWKARRERVLGVREIARALKGPMARVSPEVELREAATRVRARIRSGLESVRARRVTARVRERLGIREARPEKVPSVKRMAAALRPPVARVSEVELGEVTARVKSRIKSALESARGRRAIDEVRAKFAPERVRPPETKREPSWLADAKREAKKIAEETRERYLRLGMEPGEVEEVTKRVKRRLMQRLEELRKEWKAKHGHE